MEKHPAEPGDGPFADQYEAAITAMDDAATRLRDAIDAGDAAAIATATQDLLDGLAAYAALQGGAGDVDPPDARAEADAPELVRRVPALRSPAPPPRRYAPFVTPLRIALAQIAPRLGLFDENLAVHHDLLATRPRRTAPGSSFSRSSA